MKRYTPIIVLLLAVSIQSFAQRSNVVAVFQLVENEKFADAKKAIDEAVEHDKTWDWHRTWYAKGYLCLTAYEKGIKDKNKKLYELYPDQLYVAFESFEKSVELNKNGRGKEMLGQYYIQLSNDFVNLGESEYKAKKYKESLKAYEHSLKLMESEYVEAAIDTSLIYNTALAAFKAGDEVKSKLYLGKLTEMKYSENVSHLLYSLAIGKNDTVYAAQILREGILLYPQSEDLVLLLADLKYRSNHIDVAVAVLDSAMHRDSANYK